MRIKLGLSGLSPIQLLDKARYVKSQMSGNLNFVTPTPTLGAIQTAIDELSAANDDANTGSYQALVIRNGKYENLLNLMKVLGAYVQMQSQGVEEVITSSGFSVIQPSNPAGLPPVVANLSANPSQFEHCSNLEWKSLKTKAKSYVICVTQTDPALPSTQWEAIGYSTKASFLAENLGNTAPQYFWFAVYGVNSAGNGPMSDPAKCLVL